MSKTTNKFSPEVRERAVRLVLDTEAQHPSRWQAVMSIAAKIGCTPQTLNDWVKKAEVDSGRRPGVPAEMAEWSCPRFTGHSGGCGLSCDELAGRAHFQP
jgi:transposase-like protein